MDHKLQYLILLSYFTKQCWLWDKKCWLKEIFMLRIVISTSMLTQIMLTIPLNWGYPQKQSWKLCEIKYFSLSVFFWLNLKIAESSALTEGFSSSVNVKAKLFYLLLCMTSFWAQLYFSGPKFFFPILVSLWICCHFALNVSKGFGKQEKAIKLGHWQC